MGSIEREGAHDFDVVVVGCGVAGLSAAVAAAEAGAAVAVLERSTYDERGGNTRYTTAAIRMKSDDAVSDDFESAFLDNCGYHVQPDFAASTVLDYANWSPLVRAAAFTDPELISFFADSAPPTIAWLKAHGVKFGGIGFYGLTPRASPRIAISGGGLHLIEVMTAHADEHRRQILLRDDGAGSGAVGARRRVRGQGRGENPAR